MRISDWSSDVCSSDLKLLGLGYPGGPAVERAAEAGDPDRFDLPRPMLGRPGCDFSFSGLKTAVRRRVEQLGDGLDERARADLAAGFQAAVAASLVDRSGHAIDRFEAAHGGGHAFVVAGGVAANRSLQIGRAHV